MAGVYRRRGKWVADFRDGAKKRHQYFRRTKAEAEAVLAKHQVEIQRGTFEPLARTATLADLAARYLEAKAPTWRPTTRDLNTATIRRHVLSADYGLGGQRVAAISLPTCEQFRARMMAANPSLGPRAVNLAMIQLGALLRYGERSHLRADNPARHVARLPEPRREVEILEPAQIEALLGALPAERDRVIVELALRTGARWGELAALSWGDVGEEVLRIAATNSHRESRRHFVATGAWPSSPKTEAGAREVILSPGARALLKRWRLANGRPEPGALLFVNEAGRPLDGKNWRERIWHPALAAAGIRAGFPFHATRHCYASRMLSEGAALELVARQLGHSSVNITARIYRHWIVDRDAEQAALIDSAIGDSRVLSAPHGT